jgi:hypothetical protein
VDDFKLTTSILYFFLALADVIQINYRCAHLLSFNVWERRTLIAIERDFMILHCRAQQTVVQDVIARQSIILAHVLEPSVGRRTTRDSNPA